MTKFRLWCLVWSIGFLFLIKAPLFSDYRTELVDFKVTKWGTQYVYSGYVILKETSEPMSKGFAYLVEADTHKIISETPLGEDGYFELIGEKPGLSLMFSTSRLTQRTAEEPEIPILEKLYEKREKMFPKGRYGRESLIKRRDAKIVIGTKEARLYVSRNFDFDSSDVLNGEAFDDEEAACAFLRYAQSLPEYHTAQLCYFKIPYQLAEKQIYVRHTLLHLTLQDKPTRLLSFYIDPTGLVQDELETELHPASIVESTKEKGLDILKRASKSVVLSPSVPMAVIGDCLVYSGIWAHKGQIIVEYSMHKFELREDALFEILKNYKFQIQLPRIRFPDFRETVRPLAADTFYLHLPEYAKLYQIGEKDSAMQEAYEKSVEIVYQIVQKSQLAEELPKPKSPLEEKLELIEERVAKETEWGRRNQDYIEKKNTRLKLDLSCPMPARYYFGEDSIHYNPSMDATIEKWAEELKAGYPIRSILRLHEELHRAQMNLGKWGEFIAFYRKFGGIQETMLPDGRKRTSFTLGAEAKDKILSEVAQFFEEPPENLKQAIKMLS